MKSLILRNFFIYLLVFLASFLLFIFLESAPTFPDPDGFYHTKMAILMSKDGIIKNFPYLQFTNLKDHWADHHLLYHTFLIPFTFFPDPLIGVKYATALLGAIFITLFYWFLFKFTKIKMLSIFLTAALLGSAPFLFRASLIKANTFSLIIFFLSVYAIFKKKYILLGALSYIFVISYGGWIILPVFLTIYLFSSFLELKIYKKWKIPKIRYIKKLQRKHKYLYNIIAKNLTKINLLPKKNQFDFKNQFFLLVSTGIGITAGLILTPYFPHNLYFYLEQIVQIAIINQGSKIGVGGEWYPYNLTNILADAPGFAVIFFISFFVFFKKYKKQDAKSIVFFLFTLLFLGATLKSRRYIEYFIPIGIIFSGLSLKNWLKDKKIYLDMQNFKHMTNFSLTFGLIFFVSIASAVGISKTKKELNIGNNLSIYKKSALFLQKNSAKNTNIFHADWDDFPMLFYQNHHNNYIVGLDPTFMYNYNREKYQEWVNITTGKNSKNLSQKIKNDFNSNLVFMDTNHQSLNRNLMLDDNFELIYKDNEAIIYKVK